MEKLSENKYPIVRQEGNGKKIILPGYPTYPASEDIYNQGKEEKEINPEDISGIKGNENSGVNNEMDSFYDLSGSDLDVPGSELDDPQEEIGSEDEENNLKDLIQIYFFTNTENGTKVEPIAIDEYSGIINWPKDFFDQTDNKKRGKKNKIDNNLKKYTYLERIYPVSY